MKHSCHYQIMKEAILALEQKLLMMCWMSLHYLQTYKSLHNNFILAYIYTLVEISIAGEDYSAPTSPNSPFFQIVVLHTFSGN